MPRIRIRIDPRLQSAVLGAVGRLELNFDLRVGVKRARAIEWNKRLAAKYGFLASVSGPPYSLGLWLELTYELLCRWPSSRC